MGAVLEGCMEGITSVGFSLLHHSMKADFSLSTKYVKEIAAKVLERKLPHWVCLNVNIPAKVEPEGCVCAVPRVAIGARSTADILIRRAHPSIGLPAVS